jgi:hypothetical protein
LSLTATTAGAQAPTPDDETVFVADVNNSVYQISGSSAFLKFTIGGTNFRDLIVTDNLNFIIANHTQSGTVLLSSETGVNRVITGNIPFPEGLDIGPDEAVYVSTEGDNKIYKLVRDYAGCPVLGPSCANGGYLPAGAPFPLTVAGASLIADVSVVWSDPTGTLDEGDILVTVGSPASIRRYRSDGTSLGTLAIGFAGEQPSATTFGPGGTILVTTEQGSIWQFPPGGGAAITKIGGKARGIAFGIQGNPPAPAAFVSVDPGSVNRYPFSGNAIVDNATSIPAFNNPRGLSFAGAGGASIAAGANVSVQTPAGNTVFESVAQEGQTDAECYFFQDPGTRPLALSTVSALPQFLRNQLAVNDVIVPANVQCFVPNGGSSGLCKLCVTKTTALVDGIKEIASEESTWLNGKDPGCPLEQWEGQNNHANTFYAPEVGKGEYPIIEWSGAAGRVLQNVTEGCGSDTSWSRGRGSLLLLSAIDTTSRGTLVASGLALFDTALATSSGASVPGLGDLVNDPLKSSIRSKIQSAAKAASKKRYTDVVSAMTAVIAEADAAPGDFDPPGSVQVLFEGNPVESPDVRAEVKVRAAAIRFAACSEISAGRGRGKKALPSDCEALIGSH